MPLTDNGWETLTPDVALAMAKQDVKSNLGPDTDVSPGSPMGKIAQSWADKYVEWDNQAHDVYDNGFWNTSSGVSMDRLANSMGIQRHQAQYAQADLQITGTPGYLIPANTEFLTDNGDSFLSDLDAQIPASGQVNLSTHSAEMGSYTNVDAGTIINQANPVDEIDDVTNPLAATGGADLESDYDFRNRGNINQVSPEGPTVNGIHTALINVDGVTGVTIQDNKTNEVDKHGNPSHSMHIYVVGGDNIDIANKLAECLAGGATTIGQQSYDVNIANNPVTVNFDRSIQVTLSFKLDMNTSSGYDVDSVKQAVQDYLSNFEMGDKIILNKLYQYLYNLSGIDLVNSIQVKTNDSEYSNQDLQLTSFQFAVTHNENIEVVTHG